MRFLAVPIFLSALLAGCEAAPAGDAADAAKTIGWPFPGQNTEGPIQATAIAGVNGSSTLQCWELTAPNVVAAGTNVQSLGGAEKISLSSFPSNGPTDAGTHSAPNLQFFTIVKGGAIITFPDHPGKTLVTSVGHFYVAADGPDVSAKGHHTTILPGSVVLQLPFVGGELPAHTVTNEDGPCLGNNFHGWF